MNHLIHGATDDESIMVEIRASFTVDHGSVRPLGAKPAPGGRERQRSRIRERILASGKTSLDGLTETKRILRERIKERSR